MLEALVLLPNKQEDVDFWISDTRRFGCYCGFGIVVGKIFVTLGNKCLSGVFLLCSCGQVDCLDRGRGTGKNER